VAAVARHPAEAQPRGGQAALSAREHAVLALIAQGYTNKAVATQLDLSMKTVESYKARAMDKLDLRTRVDLVRYALAAGWLDSA
jgi:DNA-binding NarL/FixJ family response regulator